MLRATGCAVRVRMCGGTMYSLPTVADTVQSKARKTQDYKGLSAAEVFVIEFASGPSPLTLGVYCARVCLRSMLASAPQDTEPMVSIIYVQTAKADVATKVCPAPGRGGSSRPARAAALWGLCWPTDPTWTDTAVRMCVFLQRGEAGQ